jgi:hypothetical protein
MWLDEKHNECTQKFGEESCWKAKEAANDIDMDITDVALRMGSA